MLGKEKLVNVSKTLPPSTYIQPAFYLLPASVQKADKWICPLAPARLYVCSPTPTKESPCLPLPPLLPRPCGERSRRRLSPSFDAQTFFAEPLIDLGTADSAAWAGIYTAGRDRSDQRSA